MNFGRIIQNLPSELKKLFRKLENISRKLLNNKWSLCFNKVCTNENLLPKYTQLIITGRIRFCSYYIYIYIFKQYYKF